MKKAVSLGAIALASVIIVGTLVAGGYAAITGGHILHSSGAQHRGRAAHLESSAQVVRPTADSPTSRYGLPDSVTQEEAVAPQSATQSRTRVTEWVTYEGTLVAVGEHLVLETADRRTIEMGIGPSAHFESLDITLDVGDRISATGFLEDSEFKVKDLTNNTTGQSVTLRDESGRPAWAGRGRRGNV